MKFLFLSVLFSLTGCIKLLPDAPLPSQKLWIEISTDAPEKKAICSKKCYDHVQLLIERPRLCADLNTTKIRVIEVNGGLSTTKYLNGYEWPVSLNEMISQHLIKYFSESCQFFSVMPFESSNKGTHKLTVSVIRFDIDLTSNPTLEVEGQFALFDNRSGDVLKQQHFKYHLPLSLINIQTISQIYTQAFDRLNAESERFLKVYFN